MCGIVGAVAKRNITNVLIDGLKRLEYRGYDSAGIAVLNGDGVPLRKRTIGKVCELDTALQSDPIQGQVGIAHTRWATHGEPFEHNAHPHMSGDEIALVHNGIIENHEVLRSTLMKLNYQFSSDTDTEIIAHLIHHYRDQSQSLLEAVTKASKDLEGAFALGVVHKNDPDRIIAVRQGSPLVIGLGDAENFIASDHMALLPVAENFIFLENGDIAEITNKEFSIFDVKGDKVKRQTTKSNMKHDVINKGKYRHFMLKEIFEQPNAIQETLESRISQNKVLEAAFGDKATAIFDKVKRVQIVACGTSYHAGMIARYWFEELAGIPCRVEIASEIRYRQNIVEDGTLFVTISQSGETADTLAALKQAKETNYLASLAICNVPESSLVRESDLVFLTRAGVEIGVASTKAFTTQLTALLMLMIVLGRRHKLTSDCEKSLVKQLHKLPKICQDILNLDQDIKILSEDFADKNHALFLGRGTQFPVALEGALKLKEISYIHAEAYPAGELKHGPLALVDKNMPVIVVAPNDELFEKLKSNLYEVRARGGELYVFADKTAKLTNGDNVHITEMPAIDKCIAPIVYTIPLQLLAYHVAVLKGTDVDQPRNLAKSVTVE